MNARLPETSPIPERLATLRNVMAREVIVRAVISKTVRQENKRDEASECKTGGGSERIFLHGAD